MGYGVPYWLARLWIEPESRSLKVITGTITCPCGGMIEQNHALIFVDIGVGSVGEVQLLDVGIGTILPFLWNVECNKSLKT